MKTVVEKLFENADLHPDKLAVVFENEEVTYGQLKDAVIRLASWFKLHGVAEGDRIIAQAHYGKWYIAAYYAAHLCGAAFIPVEKTLSDKTLSSIIQQMSAKVVVSWLAPHAEISLSYGELDELADKVELQPWAFPDPGSVGAILLTSGTTGTPKGAMLTNKNIAAIADVIVHEANIPENDIGITFLPLNHAAPMRRMDAAVYGGSTYIFIDGVFKLHLFYAYISKYHVTSFYVPPSGITVLQQFSQDKLYEYSDQIQYVYIVGSVMQEPQREFLKRVLPKSTLLYIYGTSENGTLSMLHFDHLQKDIRCTGKPCKGVDIRVLDENYHDVHVGKTGRLAIRSDMNFLGYWDMPEITDSLYCGDYFLSNDAGYFDSDGYLYVLGRIDDIINIGGLKVHPTEIENAALEIEGIEECICFDIPNELTGSAACLLVRCRDETLKAKAIRAQLLGKLDTYKIPSRIEIISEIKKTESGKPDRKYYRRNFIL